MLCIRDMSRGLMVSFEGQLRGPHCTRSRTLPASFTISHCECNGNVASCSTSLITDPCYWTPELPFLYDLEVEVALADGTKAAWQHTVGLRRWDVDGRHLFRERRRVVLRGAVVAKLSSDNLSEATEAEVALMLSSPSESLLQHACQLGVPLVIDLRGATGDLSPRLLNYTWQPAVALILLDASVSQTHYKPQGTILGCVVQSGDVEVDYHWVDVFAVQLSKDQLPPAWIADCGKPVIAIRDDAAYANFKEARRGCDRLQAELAPQFDLAGYFV